MALPLISCILPTYNRRRFLPQALRCFANRTYSNAELIVIDDSERSVRSLCSGLENVRYLRVRVSSTGAKLNLGIEAARGEIIQRIDDDDYYGPGFLGASLRALQGQDPPHSLVARCCFLTLVRSDGVLRHSGHHWTPGATFCFHRELWRRIPFRDVENSEDTHFLRDHRPEILRICNPRAVAQYILVRHGRNHWTRVRASGSAEAMETDDFLRTRPPYTRLPGQILDAESLAFYRRILRWSC